jgi:Tfp pilus assembly protein PilE
VAVCIIALLAAIALPNYIKIKGKAKEAETKSALHNIQLELERFAVDHEGAYPDYLIGGDNSIFIGATSSSITVNGYTQQIPASQCSDTLLREGYVTTYPRNPFVNDSRAVWKLQSGVGDALRNMSETGSRFGTRFGAYGKVMGQVLCDARWISRECTDAAGTTTYCDTYSSIQYDFYDVWLGNMQKPFLPGSFMYKGMGDIIPNSGLRQHLITAKVGDKNSAVQFDSWDQPTFPISINRYMLSAWGAYHTKGMDLLGEEPYVFFNWKGTRRTGGSAAVIFSPQAGASLKVPGTIDVWSMLGVPPWTRGVNRSHVGPLWGSPFGPGSNELQMSYGNPNGRRDALIILLTAGENPDSAER